MDIPYTKLDLTEINLREIAENFFKERNNYLPGDKIIRQIQYSLLFTFPFKQMENVVCAIAKNENKYIND